ncbi:hypothetical protein GCM10020367_70550 [Streptomyces sannanensis]|uniref:Uncharacterized protein n=1 Tax=Streptomyces sannanensis TaxID=285536 RepID=A0ABP6SN61_9ACTN
MGDVVHGGEEVGLAAGGMGGEAVGHLRAASTPAPGSSDSMRPNRAMLPLMDLMMSMTSAAGTPGLGFFALDWAAFSTSLR